MQPIHPEIIVKLVGEDGNPFAILGRCQQAARQAGLPKPEIDSFIAEATSDDYDHLLQTCLRWFEIKEAFRDNVDTSAV
jgi:hypothetical protein